MKTGQPLKMAANKTFQVSRKPQYKREKPRSPLASLNEGKAVRERSVSKLSPADEYFRKSEEMKALNSTQRQRSLALSAQENVYRLQRNSPLVLLVPGGKPMDSGHMSASPDANQPDSKELPKMLNRTLSPVGTPDVFKQLMPRIQSDGPLSANNVADADGALTGPPVPSLKDALALIDSDLSHINASPRDTSSSCSISDSLESKSGNHGRGADGNVLEALPDSPQGSESSELRLTFFVRKKVVGSDNDDAMAMVRRASFTSATVIKSRAPVEANCSSGRKIKKSRRRLLEKTLELSDGCESGPVTPSLPVIDPGTETEGGQSVHIDNRHQVQEAASSSLTLRPVCSPTPVTFPVTSPPSTAPARFSFPATSTPPAASASVTFAVTPLPSPLGSSSPLHSSFTQHASRTLSVPLFVQEDSFPIHVAAKSKKRKSEEYFKRDVKTEDAGKAERVKRSRSVAGKTEPPRPTQERRSASQRLQPRTAGEQM